MVSQNLSIQKIPKAKQLIVVTTSNWQSVSGKLWFFEKDNQNNWLAKKLATTVVVGKNGLAWADSIYQSLTDADLKKKVIVNHQQVFSILVKLLDLLISQQLNMYS